MRPERTPSSTESIWVIGGGKFGRLAVRLLHKSTPSAKIIVVDKKPISDLPPDIDVVCAEGVEWLIEQRLSESLVTMIIPVIPIHLAAEWLKLKLGADGGIVSSEEIPENLLQQLPHPIRVRPDKIVISHADFICPENCSEPDTLCSYTHQLRPPPLYTILEEMDCGDLTPIIIRSRQFAPGVGGFYLKDLWHLLTRAKSLPGVHTRSGLRCPADDTLSPIAFTRNDTPTLPHRTRHPLRR